MKYELKEFDIKQGYISAIKLKWWQPIVYYPLQLQFAIIRFIFDLIPSWGLKSQLIDIAHTQPTDDIKRLNKSLGG